MLFDVSSINSVEADIVVCQHYQLIMICCQRLKLQHCTYQGRFQQLTGRIGWSDNWDVQPMLETGQLLDNCHSYPVDCMDKDESFPTANWTPPQPQKSSLCTPLPRYKPVINNCACRPRHWMLVSHLKVNEHNGLCCQWHVQTVMYEHDDLTVRAANFSFTFILVKRRRRRRLPAMFVRQNETHTHTRWDDNEMIYGSRTDTAYSRKS